MGHINDEINGATFTALQIKIYTQGVGTYTPSAQPGIISFDEQGQRVGINGHWYGASQEDLTNLSQNVNNIISGLNGSEFYNVTEVTGSSGVYTITPKTIVPTSVAGVTDITTVSGAITALDNLLGNIPTSVVGTDVSDVAGAITALDNAIGTVPTSVDGVSGVTNVSQAITILSDGLTGVESGVSNLQTVVGDSSTGLVKDVDDLQDVVGDNNSGLVKKVNDIAATYVQSVNGATGQVTITVNGKGTGTTDIVISASDIAAIIGATGSELSGEGHYLNENITELYGKIASLDKDSFLRSGKIVYGPATGIEGGDFNARPTGIYDDNTHSGSTDPYIELVINTYDAQLDPPVAGEKYVYIKATSLVDVYDGSTGTEIDVTVTSDNHIQAVLKQNSVQSAHIVAGAVQTGHIATGAVTAEKVNIGASSAATSAANAQQEANVSSTSVVDVLGAVTVTTQNAQVTGVTGASILVDKAGAAQAALVAANLYTDTGVAEAKSYADTIITWDIINTAPTGNL